MPAHRCSGIQGWKMLSSSASRQWKTEVWKEVTRKPTHTVRGRAEN